MSLPNLRAVQASAGRPLVVTEFGATEKRSTNMQVSSPSAATLGSFCRPMKVLYPAPVVRSGASVCVRYFGEHWTKIAIAIVGGVLAGFLAGAVSSREYMPLNQVVYAAGAVPSAEAPMITAALRQSPGEQAALQEMSRLRAENQQLQALVDELQKERPAVHSRKGKAHHHRRSGAPG
jgi:hypothetical protein